MSQSLLWQLLSLQLEVTLSPAEAVGPVQLGYLIASCACLLLETLVLCSKLLNLQMYPKLSVGQV